MVDIVVYFELKITVAHYSMSTVVSSAYLKFSLAFKMMASLVYCKFGTYKWMDHSIKVSMNVVLCL